MMQQVTRRGVLSAMGLSAGGLVAGNFAAGALASAPNRVQSTKDASLPHGAGYYRFAVGTGEQAVACYSIGDAQARIPSYPLWGQNASEADVVALLRDYFVEVPPAPMLVHFNVLMFKVAGDVWLVDAGNGPRAAAQGGDGRLLATLEGLGVAPADVRGIIISHLHGDHIDGLLTRDGGMQFPNAAYFVSTTERDFWSGTPDLSRTALDPGWKQGMIANAQKVLTVLEKSGKLQLVADGDRLTTGVRVRQTGGHTPGHQTVEIESGGDKFIMLADAVHHFVMSFRRPDWHVQFDYDATVGAMTRRRVLEQVANERTKVMCYHTPWPGIGHVRSREGAFDWLPIAWEWQG